MYHLSEEAMQAKTFEILDVGTFIPVLAIRLDPTNAADRYLLARAGFGRTPEKQREYVHVCLINGGRGESSCDPYGWSDHYKATMTAAHQYIDDHFDELESGAVIDSQFLRGESQSPKVSEAALWPV